MSTLLGRLKFIQYTLTLQRTNAWSANTQNIFLETLYGGQFTPNYPEFYSVKVNESSLI